MWFNLLLICKNIQAFIINMHLDGSIKLHYAKEYCESFITDIYR